MTVSLDLSETDVLTALKAFLVTLLPVSAVVRGGQANRAATPGGTFVTMTPVMRRRLGTTKTTRTAAQTMAEQATELIVQVDVYGPGSGDQAQTITTMFRSSVGADYFAGIGMAIAPLYADEARQMPLLTSERQFEDRWSVDCHLQYNPVVTIDLPTAATVKVGIIEVDATYPAA